MPDCTFIRDRPGHIVCTVCGFARDWPDDASPLPTNCRSRPAQNHAPNPPGFFRRAANFARAALDQAPLFAEALLTGDESAAVRSDAEIAANFALCQGCRLFDGRACTHAECGCALDPERSAFFSKLAWRSAVCPLDKWPKP